MKYLMILLGMVFLLGTVEISSAGSKVPTVKTSTHPNSFAVNKRLRDYMQQIQKDIKTRKLTKQEAQNLRVKLKAVRVQELQFLKANGSNELTIDQANQLNKDLDDIGAAI